MKVIIRKILITCLKIWLTVIVLAGISILKKEINRRYLHSSLTLRAVAATFVALSSWNAKQRADYAKHPSFSAALAAPLKFESPSLSTTIAPGSRVRAKMKHIITLMHDSYIQFIPCRYCIYIVSSHLQVCHLHRTFHPFSIAEHYPMGVSALYCHRI